ncbi:MAG: hypothetical protein IE886_01220 [Campylobacterales bacterium]|nr:hypothetical protein [Campylobacterales bacterium]
MKPSRIRFILLAETQQPPFFILFIADSYAFVSSPVLFWQFKGHQPALHREAV